MRNAILLRRGFRAYSRSVPLSPAAAAHPERVQLLRQLSLPGRSHAARRDAHSGAGDDFLKEAERTITLYAATAMPNHAHILFSIRPLQPEAGAVPHFANDQAHFSVEGEQAGWARGRAVAAGVVRSHAAHEQR